MKISRWSFFEHLIGTQMFLLTVNATCEVVTYKGLFERTERLVGEYSYR